MKTGDKVLAHPASDPGEPAAADVDLLSSNGKAIALRMRDRPSWFRPIDGILLRKDDGRIEMLLLRDELEGAAIGLWFNTNNRTRYAIKAVKP